jgi:hypothetical protein
MAVRFRQVWSTGAGVLLAAVFTLLASACSLKTSAATPTVRSAIEGKVTFRGEALAGAVVTVYDTMTAYREGLAAYTCGPTAENGDFAVDLPPGRYYVTAAAEGPGAVPGRLFNFHGSNPVAVPPSTRVPLGISMAPLPPPPRFMDDPETGGGGIAGVVLHEGEPLAAATVFLYLGEQTDFKGTAYAVAPPTDEEGRFSLSGLVESGYYVLVRKRAGRQLAGPLAPGDFYGFYAFNPLQVRRGVRAEIVVETIAKSDDPLTVNRGPERAPTRIEGTIVAPGGTPMGGLYAFVYPDRIMSHAKPLAISNPSREDGRFVLFLGGGGRFFLGARERYGTNPQPGEYYGKYTGTPDHSIFVEEGEVRDDVTIVVDRILE